MDADDFKPEPNREGLAISSPAFADGGLIPKRHTCDGKNLSPELVIEGMPAKAKSLAIVMHDPDAPGGDFLHWLVFNLPANACGLDENVRFEEGRGEPVEAVNGFGQPGYGGPCPPPGKTHRYFFTAYALSKRLDLPPLITRAFFLDEIKNLIMDEARLMGRYTRL